MQQYAKMVAEYSTHSQSSYVRLYNDDQIAKGIVDKLFWDVDSDSLEAAHRDFLKLVETFRTLQYKARYYFTGSKGFAAYVDFEPRVANFESLKDFQQRIADLAGVKVDDRVMGDRKRFCRIPYTPNVKSLKHRMGMLYCIPIDPSWTLDQIIEASQHCKGAPVQIEACPNILRDIEALPPPKQVARFTPNMNTSNSALNEAARQRMVMMVDYLINNVAPKIRDGRHRCLNFLLVPALVQLGADRDTIHAAAQEFIERSGKTYSRGDYYNHVENAMKRSRDGNWKAWHLDTFRRRYPKVLPE